MGYRKGHYRKDGSYVRGHYVNNGGYGKGCLLLILIMLFAGIGLSFSQQKEYDKDKALYRVKYFIAKSLGEESESSKFIIDPLAASKSTELTSVYFESLKHNIRGLVLGFFDGFWTKESGANFQGYGFKHLNQQEATKLLNKIEKIISEEKKFLNETDDENNIYFTFDDITVLIYRKDALSGRLRLFWNGFDAEWENTAFRRTKRRFERSTK